MNIALPNFKKASILVIGDVMLDRYWYGPIDRISPEAPVPIVTVKKKEERPGGAANVAMNIAALGAKVHLIGFIGIDDAAITLTNQLRDANVYCDLISLSTHPTIIKLRIISHNQQLIRIDSEEEYQCINTNTKQLFDRIKPILPNFGAIVLSDYGKGALTKVSSIIDLANEINIPVLIDPKGTDFHRYRGATLLTPNITEFEAIVGKCNTNFEIEQKGINLINRLNLQALLITRSEQGMILLQNKKAPIQLITKAQKVSDATGAGDTVIGVLAAVLATGFDFNKACILANAAASVVVGKLGTSTVSLTELNNALFYIYRSKSSSADTNFGVMNEEQLKYAVAAARKYGEKIVMTNGCFDLLHAGHVIYLANARKLGDRLIVAVNSDNSINRLKGEGRPINPLAQRMIVLGALDSVDWVVSFEEDTPHRLISEIMPDILVKGGDYKYDEIAGSHDVLAAGGEVKILNFEAGFSTSNIINSIKKLNLVK